ncbi:MAG: formylglycine-generating enzyme family protein [Desulfatiglandaceae bacterium]
MDNTRGRSSRLSILFSLILMSSLLLGLPAFALEKAFTNSLGMEFVLIPAGSFTMGSPTGEPHRNRDEVQHKVTISKPFYMQTTEVTLKQWRALMGRKFFGRRKGSDNMPVVKVSWYDCMDFIEKLNSLKEGAYRLPTEAEWEYACRAGSTTAYSWGKGIDCSKAMFSNNTRKSEECIDYIKSKGMAVDRPGPVKSYPPNAWGLYDMHGNVWEWCQDRYGFYPKGAAVDPRGPDSGTDKVRRGGSWFKYGYYCRSANRNWGLPTSRYQTTGFRVVREAE